MIAIVALVAVFFLGYGSILTYGTNQSENNALAQSLAQDVQEQSKSVQLRYMPEDAVLRRHFVAQLRHEVEAEMSPRPTDSILRRHHDAIVTAELNHKLASIKPLTSA